MADPHFYGDLAHAEGIRNAVIRLNKRVAEAMAAGLTVRLACAVTGKDGGRERGGSEIRVVKVKREKGKA